MARTQLSRWGHSLAVRIPKTVAEEARLREGDHLSLAAGKDGAVVIRSTRKRYGLEDLVSKITAKNRHRETDWGAAVGNEVW